MRKLILVLAMTAAFVNAGDRSEYVIAAGGKVGIYQNQTRGVYETPLFTVDSSMPLMVVGKSARSLNVKCVDGSSGWVERRLVKNVSSKSICFSDAQVDGYMDNPNMSVIFAGNESPEEAIKLSRSFKECLSENVDRETICRAAE